MAINVQKAIDEAVQGNTAQSSLATQSGVAAPTPNAPTFSVPAKTDTEPAIISSRQGEKEVARVDEKLRTLQGDPDENKKLLDAAVTELRSRLQPQKTETTTENKDSITYINPETGQETTLQGNAINDKTRADLEAQGYQVSEANLGTSEDPVIAQVRKETEAAQTELADMFERLYDTAISSEDLRKQTRAIERRYSARIREMERINERRYKALNTTGIRLGSRYTGGAGGIMGGILTEEERQGLERIFTIESEMQAEIERAKQNAREFNFTLYTNAVEKAQEKYDAKVAQFQSLQEAQAKAEQEIQDELELVENQASIVEQIQAGVTNPTDIFAALGGAVPFDMIKEITDTLPENGEPVKLGSADLLVDPKTGEVIARGSKVGGSGGSGGVGTGTTLPVASNGGLIPGETRGTAIIAGLGTSYATSTEDAQFQVERIFNRLPTQMKNSVTEHPLWKNSIVNYLKRGYTQQETIDELSGFGLFDGANKELGYTLFNLAQNTEIEPQELSGLINRGGDKQAMLMVEDARLNDVDLFFASPDETHGYISAIKEARDLLADENFPKKFLGSYDGRKFKATRFLGKDATNEERKMLQQLETQLAIINSPIRVSIAGTAATPAEMDKITAMQADILDNPGTVDTILGQMQQSILGFHNSARRERGLPSVDVNTVLNTDERLNLYREMGAATIQHGISNQSNKDLLLGNTGIQSGTDTGIPSTLQSLK